MAESKKKQPFQLLLSTRGRKRKEPEEQEMNKRQKKVCVVIPTKTTKPDTVKEKPTTRKYVVPGNHLSTNRLNLENLNARKTEKEHELLVLCGQQSLDKEQSARFSQLALDKALDVNCTKRNNNQTPLLLLCRSNKSDSLIPCITALLQREATDVNAKDSDGMSVLSSLCFHSSGKLILEGVRLLLGHKGIDLTSANNNGWTALHALIFNYNRDITNFLGVVRELLDAGVPLNAVAVNGWNSLLALCSHHRGHREFIDVARLLVDRGVNLHWKDKQGLNAMTIICSNKYASENDLVEIVRLLVKYGIDVGVQDKNGRRPVELLLKRGFTSNSETIQNILSLGFMQTTQYLIVVPPLVL